MFRSHRMVAVGVSALASLALGACSGSSSAVSPPELPPLTSRPRPSASGPLVVVKDLDRACIRVLVAKSPAAVRLIRRRLRRGEHFVDLVRRHSKAGPVERGGLLGCYNLARLDPNLARAVARLKVGRVGGPILTRYGPTLVQRTTHYHFRLARQFEARGIFARAEVQYRKDLALNPDRVASWRGLGRLSLKQGRRDLARKYLARALALNPRDQEAAVILARLKASGRARPAAGRFLVARQDGASALSAPLPPTRVVFHLPRYAPVKVVSRSPTHFFVQNWRGRRGWIVASALAPGPYVMVTEESAGLRRRPDPKSKVAYVCVVSSVLRVLERRGPWLKLSLDTKRSGWIHRKNLFGVGPHLSALISRRKTK
ncbi:MAG: tetratricopeptide repeat protein [Proteobacteria bacterium]|nr:tetratricopeptide repeat protein [Pseudomonadota bacterium]